MADKKPVSRAEKTAATRARVLAAARDRFVEQGFESATMQGIARAAGVSEQTLYLSFGNKRTLLSAVLDVAVAGDTRPIATLERSWVGEAMASPPEQLLVQLVSGAGEIHARTAQILEVVRSAARSDPQIAELWRTNIEQRLTVCVAFAGALSGKTQLRAGMSAARAADVMLAVLAPELYGLLVRERSWTGEEWAAWAADALIRQLLP